MRLPVLRKIAKDAVKYNADIGDYYYEERMLRGLAIGYKKCGIDEYLMLIKEFVPLIDNWAVCDSCCSGFKFTNKNKAVVWDFIQPYLNGSEYEIRFAVVMMMDYFLDDEYIDRVLEILPYISSDKYYVNMAVAWALSVAFVKYQDKTMPIIERGALNDTVAKMTVRKICDSYRVDKGTKEYLKNMKK
ncbi:MAG: DNA alkylation repair protein [Eubacterium sp.]